MSICLYVWHLRKKKKRKKTLSVYVLKRVRGKLVHQQLCFLCCALFSDAMWQVKFLLYNTTNFAYTWRTLYNGKIGFATSISTFHTTCNNSSSHTSNLNTSITILASLHVCTKDGVWSESAGGATLALQMPCSVLPLFHFLCTFSKHHMTPSTSPTLPSPLLQSLPAILSQRC